MPDAASGETAAAWVAATTVLATDAAVGVAPTTPVAIAVAVAVAVAVVVPAATVLVVDNACVGAGASRGVVDTEEATVGVTDFVALAGVPGKVAAGKGIPDTDAGFSATSPGPLAAEAAAAGTAGPTEVAGAAAVTGAAGVAAIRLRSPIFLESSATRVDASLLCLSLAILSSAAAWLCRAPLERVSLSGVAATAARSSTLACTFPVD